MKNGGLLIKQSKNEARGLKIKEHHRQEKVKIYQLEITKFKKNLKIIERIGLSRIIK